MADILFVGIPTTGCVEAIAHSELISLDYNSEYDLLIVKGGNPFIKITYKTIEDLDNSLGINKFNLLDEGKYIILSNLQVGDGSTDTFIDFSEGELFIPTDTPVSIYIKDKVYSLKDLQFRFNSLAYLTYEKVQTLLTEVNNLINGVSDANEGITNVKGILNRVGLR